MQARLIFLLGRLLPQPLLHPFPKSHHQDRPSSTLCPCPASAGGAHLSFTQLSQVGLVDRVLLVVRDPRGTLVSRYFISMHFNSSTSSKLEEVGFKLDAEAIIVAQGESSGGVTALTAQRQTAIATTWRPPSKSSKVSQFHLFVEAELEHLSELSQQYPGQVGAVRCKEHHCSS